MFGIHIWTLLNSYHHIAIYAEKHPIPCIFWICKYHFDNSVDCDPTIVNSSALNVMQYHRTPYIRIASHSLMSDSLFFTFSLFSRYPVKWNTLPGSCIFYLFGARLTCSKIELNDERVSCIQSRLP